MSDCWDAWIPGVLSARQLRQLCEDALITGSRSDATDYSALDLHLSDDAFELTGGSIKPFGERYLSEICRASLAKPLDPTSDGHFLLEAKHTYLFTLQERLYAMGFRRSPIHGQATAKSSVGRVDVLARLIVDGMDCYDEFAPTHVATGDMYLEVTPITFSVLVKPGIALSQLRLICDHPDTVDMRGPQAVRTLLRGSNVTDPSLTVDLTNVDIAGASAAAFRAKSNNPAPVRLWDSGVLATPADYWDRIEVDSTERLRIEKGRFYILRSFEQMSLPGSVAVYCRAIDETIGEIRIHYAGFVHPFFGHDREDHAPGTPLIFEVRGHSIDVNLKHRERMARLVFYRMSEAAERNEAPESPYESQTLKLSKLFTAWD